VSLEVVGKSVGRSVAKFFSDSVLAFVCRGGGVARSMRLACCRLAGSSKDP
jgi:hypothetical protein